jgi:transcriptional regulator with XRE-family HTH domain
VIRIVSMTERTTIGERVRVLREARGLSQRQLGLRAETSGAYISQLESGVTTRPGMEQVRRIAQALGVRPEALMEEGDGDNHLQPPDLSIEQAASLMAAHDPKYTVREYQELLRMIRDLDEFDATTIENQMRDMLKRRRHHDK